MARFLSVALPDLERFLVFDLSKKRAAELVARVEGSLPGVAAEPADGLDEFLAQCSLVSFATNAVEPHVQDLAVCLKGATILLVSLRDLGPEAILAADNVVDDPDHLTRAQTSVHLAEQRTGSRDFIRCTLAQVLEGTAPPKPDPDAVTVFSPFGLGVLDLALADHVLKLAREGVLGLAVASFLPEA